MPKRTVFCDECDAEYTISFKGKETPHYCSFCGEEIDPDWNSDETDIEE